MNELRLEIRELLAGTECVRPAALRRSRQEDYLFTTDLPAAASAEAAEEFRRKAEEAGWRTKVTDGWIELDRIPEKLSAGFVPDSPGPEARCCASLLRRHRDKRKNGDREKRLLLKAAEEGPDTYEKACGSLHREWAAALRKGETLPDLPAEYFGEGLDT